MKQELIEFFKAAEHHKKGLELLFNLDIFADAWVRKNQTPSLRAEEYYIQNTDAGYLGNAIVFWAKNRNGYTAKLEKAGKYSYEDTEEICQGNPHKNKAWSVKYINENEGTCKLTDSQYLDKEFIISFDKPE